MTNGYIVLTKGDAKLYQHAVESINLGKPIYFVDAENKAIYFGNKIAVVDSNVVINAGNDTITIEADGDVTVTTSGGESKLFKYILYLRNETLSLDYKLSFTSTTDADVNLLDESALKSGALTDYFGLISNDSFQIEYVFVQGDDPMIASDITAIKTDNKITAFNISFYNLTTNQTNTYRFDFDSSIGKISLTK